MVSAPYIGVDVGGTFTDIYVVDPTNGRVRQAFKLPSTPDNPAAAILDGLDRLNDAPPARIFHGTTVGTNALIQKRGARTALVTTTGFRDVLELRRQARPRLYDLRPVVSSPLTPRERRFEVDERMAYDGTVLTPLDEDCLNGVVESLAKADVEAVAVDLLHAYANDMHERAVAAAIAGRLPDIFVTLGSEVCREFREFERVSTTVVNAYLGPVVGGYVADLQNRLKACETGPLAIVKSNGGVTSAANARRYPVHLIESGPAAGTMAAVALSGDERIGNLIAFDMGGTTAKVGVIQDGVPRLTTEFAADRFVEGRDHGGYPIKSPVIDMIEIGAGGGSIARIDQAGVIKVGPESAGADPGPACYARGGERPTVTDAHLVAGTLAAESFGGDGLTLDSVLARDAIERDIAAPLGWRVERAAHAILRLATANMAEMVRLATLRRGLDPRDFALLAYGGAGPLHAAEIAREVGARTVLVPPYPGLFSATGTLLGGIRHDLVQTVMCDLADIDPKAIPDAFVALQVRANDAVAAEAELTAGVAPSLTRSLDLRFKGQLFELNLPLSDGPDDTAAIEAAFRDLYQRTYGYDLPAVGVEVVNARLSASLPLWLHGLPAAIAPSDAPMATRRVVDESGAATDLPVWPRGAIPADEPLDGPLLVHDDSTTVRVLAGQRVKTLSSGVLQIVDVEG